jgi:hypothetical protein
MKKKNCDKFCKLKKYKEQIQSGGFHILLIISE